MELGKSSGDPLKQKPTSKERPLAKVGGAMVSNSSTLERSKAGSSTQIVEEQEDGVPNKAIAKTRVGAIGLRPLAITQGRILSSSLIGKSKGTQDEGDVTLKPTAIAQGKLAPKVISGSSSLENVIDASSTPIGISTGIKRKEGNTTKAQVSRTRRK